MNLLKMQNRLNVLKMQLDEISEITQQVINAIYDIEEQLDAARDLEMAKKASPQITKQYNVDQLLQMGVLTTGIPDSHDVPKKECLYNDKYNIWVG